MNLQRLQSHLLAEVGSARPTSIYMNRESNYLVIGVVHRRDNGILDLLSGSIKVTIEDTIILNGTWTPDETLSVVTAIQEVLRAVRIVLRDEEEESAKFLAEQKEVVLEDDPVEETTDLGPAPETEEVFFPAEETEESDWK